MQKITSIPVLPLRDIVVFPNMIVPLFVGREASIKALNEVMGNNKKILLLAQKNSNLDLPKSEDLYHTGTLANILQLLKLPDGTLKVLVEGKSRAEVIKFRTNDDYFLVDYNVVKSKVKSSEECMVLSKLILKLFETYTNTNNSIPEEVFKTANSIKDIDVLVDTIIPHLNISIEEKQKLLENLYTDKRMEKVYSFLESEINSLNIEKKIKGRVKRQMEKTQREYYLNEQMKAIQKELGDNDDINDMAEIENKINTIKLSNEAKEKAKSELKKLKNMSPMSAEATVVRNYLDWILNIPWNERAKIKKDIKNARKILDEDHYGLHKVKDRIIEYLAVQKRKEKIKGPILCLVGPPGVGKTSLGKSIARCTGRSFVRMSLGGVRDEAEIRGHRRTYIGSMPGKIIQGIKKTKHSNPLFLLDEVDKLGSDWRGDPSSALLEVLDPEQNFSFNDHYLEVDYDLSDVMFICTANTLNIPPALYDRMEVLRIAGYTEEEKVQIAKKYLIPKQIELNGLLKKEIKINDKITKTLIRYYTREAGVRGLEREIAKISRKVVKEIETTNKKLITLNEKNVEKFSGIKKYRSNEIEKSNLVGITNGLAWTETGGELLSIEVSTSRGKGKLTITGKLGEVMKESVQAATSFVKSQSHIYGIKPSTFDKLDIHIHVPEGATPKDGPSAGVAIFNSIVSAFTGVKSKKDTAMTGEITLRGRILPIGGLKEKLLAAVRTGIKNVIIPLENKKDLAEVPPEVAKKLKIIPLENANEILKYSLTKTLNPIKLDESEMFTDISSNKDIKNKQTTIAH
ncbi:MAG: endopeptidase La [Pelagibacteraceae bacterium]|nr:endopeptidase La [Pelagibacteraceae bacterium]|tara:strand:+ start:8802 stop:11198 length:2397 start_codon:yes stop_codon:yes gene_type:complete